MTSKIPQEHIEITCDIVSWFTADLVKKLRARDWLAAAVNLSTQQERLASLANVMMEVAQAEQQVGSTSSIGMLLDSLIELQETLQKDLATDLGDMIAKSIEGWT